MQHLTDPAPILPPGSAPLPGQWWPPRMLDPEWIVANRSSFDVAHVQFGVEQVDLQTLALACDALRASGAPLVVTVHDLVNPQLRSDAESQKPHRERLDLLIGRADEIVTLTEGAAREISTRWCRVAQVIAHPSMVPPHLPLSIGTPSLDATISIHLGDLRPNVRGLATVATVLAAVDELHRQGTRVRVRVHLRSRVRDVVERDRVLAVCRDNPLVEVIESARHSDADLRRIASDTDVCVLPYGHGTHSGWLELYYDLGVAVVSPEVGYFREQHDDDGFFFPVVPRSTVSMASSMARVLADALAHPATTRSGTAERSRLQVARRARRERGDQNIRLAHSELYLRTLAAVSA